MSKKLLFKGGHATGMIPYEIEDFSTLYMRDARVDEKTKAYIDSVIGNSVLNLCPYRNVLVTHKYDTVEGNVITLDDCQDDEVIQLSEVQGNTMVNCCKDGSKELTLNGNIDTSGYNNVTLTEGVDGGKVDIALEGNTMVNVYDQEDPIAITKNYEVTTGNHIALQGEYDGKSRPNIYGNTLVNLWDINSVELTGQIVKADTTIKIKTTDNKWSNFFISNKDIFKPSTEYTFIINVKKNTLTGDGCISITSSTGGVERDVFNSYNISAGKTGIFVAKLTTIADFSQATYGVRSFFDNATQTVDCEAELNIIILEGDYTNKPIPEYFTGMQSSFEDKLITDEKDAHNGKYKVEYKVTGKNLFNINNEFATTTTSGKEYITVNGNTTTFTPPSPVGIRKYFKIKVNPNTTYNINGTVSYGMVVIYKHNINTDSFTWDTSYIHTYRNYTKQENTTLALQFTTGVDEHEVYVRFSNELVSETSIFTNIQLEEGTKATTYEPYKEYTKTLYLNSPLLEGDTIEQSGNDIVHVHRYNKVVLDGSNYSISRGGTYDSTKYRWILYKNDNILKNTNNANILINDKYPLSTPFGTWGGDNNYIEGITINSQDTSILLYLDKYKDGSNDSRTSLTTELQQNPLTVVYKLKSPTKEVISTNDNLLLDSYVNGHLDVDSIVPIDKVVFQSYGTGLKYLSPNTEYTIQFESDNNGKLDALALNSSDVIGNLNIVKGINKFNITTSDKITINYLWTTGIGFNMSKIVVTPKVDGDFGYFKEMKSVGQDDVDGHKIEILSQNKNLFNIDETDTYTGGTRCEKNGNTLKIIPTSATVWASYNIKIRGFKHGEIYILSCVSDNYHLPKSRIAIYEKSTNRGIASWNDKFFTIPNDINVDDIYLRIHCCDGNIANISEVEISDILIEKGKIRTQFVPHKQNKKEILMNEPLRGLPNGVRDKYVMIEGKWYIERNCKQVNMSELDFAGDTNDTIKVLLFDNSKPMAISNIYSNSKTYDSLTKGQMFIQERGNELTYIWIPTDTMSNEEFKKFLNEKNATIVFAKSKPTYEPIEYNPFEVYSDITHISNNSIIPCNMIIKNSGYNCILKPSTLYTVALDTNKNGTIGMNLGGTKGTTSNNVATITTPATLTDNTLRLYGKGIKASGVRLLEGDKTNWIPSHFEGMKSCFEDRLQDDGKYKMEILSRNSDESLSNKIQFLLNEPLRGIGDIKDRLCIKDNKLMVERNCSSVTFDGREDEAWNATGYGGHATRNTFEIRLISLNTCIGANPSISNLFTYEKTNTIPVNDNAFRVYTNTQNYTYFLFTPSTSIIPYGDTDKWREYLQQNPVTAVYQLATPTYEEIEYDLSKLALEGYDHGTLFYDTNIPVTTQFYDFDVNVKDMLIPNEIYYVTFNADRVKDITINLSGVQVKYKTSMGYNKVPIQLGDVVNTNFSMDSRGVELSDLMVSTSTSIIYVKDMNDVCVYDEATNKYSITITSTNGKESDKRVILLDYPLLRLNKDIYDRLYYSNKDSRYRIDKKVFKHKFTNDHEYSKYAAETNDTYYSSFISLNEAIKDYVVITNEKVKTVKVENDKYYFKIKWSDLGVSDKTEANGNQGVKDFFNNNEVYLYYATDGFVEIVDGLRRQTLKVYQPETFMKFSGNTTTTVTILIPMKNV